MDLRRLEKKRIRLTKINGEIFEGIVGDYVFQDDNEPLCKEDAIIMDTPQCSYPIQFDRSVIKEIRIL